MTAERLNGVNQQQFTVQNPDFYPVVPTTEQLLQFSVPGTVYRLADGLQAPYTLQECSASTPVATQYHCRGKLHQLA